MKRLTLPNVELPIKFGYYDASGQAVLIDLSFVDARKVFHISSIPKETHSIVDENEFGMGKDLLNTLQYKRFYNIYNGKRRYNITLRNDIIMIENNKSDHKLLQFKDNESAYNYYMALRKA